MHYHAEVWVHSLNNIEKQVEEAMSPFREEDEDEEAKGFWDWYQIGGRWKGEHDPTYHIDKDPANFETCDLCGGTGKRKDIEVANGCNRCGGTGTAMKWPTQWGNHPLDVIPVKNIPNGLNCYTLLIPDVDLLHKSEWNGETWIDTEFKGKVKPELEKRNIKDGYLVTVDYHC